MDNIETLKRLVEDMAIKQNESLASVKKLSQAADIIGSDILNLINSTQMLGNRQFIENRIQDDDPLSINGYGAPATSRSTSPDVGKKAYDNNNDGAQRLRSILMRAVELLPPIEDEPAMEDDGDDEKLESSHEEYQHKNCAPKDKPFSQPEQQQSVPVTSHRLEDSMMAAGPVEPVNVTQEKSEIQAVDPGPSERQNCDIPKPEDHSKATDDDIETDGRKLSNEIMKELGASITKRATSPKEQVSTKPVDRDRVADILKRYSLYDDDEDDEEEDEEIE